MELLRSQTRPGVQIHQGGAELHLWAAVMHQAYWDYWHGRTFEQRSQAALWISQSGGLFEEICDLFDLDPGKARMLIASRIPARREFKGLPFHPRKREESAVDRDVSAVGFALQERPQVLAT